MVFPLLLYVSGNLVTSVGKRRTVCFKQRMTCVRFESTFCRRGGVNTTFPATFCSMGYGYCCHSPQINVIPHTLAHDS